MTLFCDTCEDGGYLDVNPSVYCDCAIGCFVEDQDNGMVQYLESIKDSSAEHVCPNCDYAHISNVLNPECTICNQSGYISIECRIYCECVYGMLTKISDKHAPMLTIQRLLHAADPFDNDYEHLVQDEDSAREEAHKNGNCTCGEDVANVTCNKCNCSGYMSTTPIEYCTCLIGLFHGGQSEKYQEMMDNEYPDAEYPMCTYELNKCVHNKDWLDCLPFYVHDE